MVSYYGYEIWHFNYKKIQKKNEGRNGKEEAITIFQRWNKNDGDGYKILSDGELK